MLEIQIQTVNPVSFLEYISNIRDNTYGCADLYICDTVLHSLSMLDHAYNIIINCTVGASGRGRDVVDGLNNVDNFYIC